MTKSSLRGRWIVALVAVGLSVALLVAAVIVRAARQPANNLAAVVQGVNSYPWPAFPREPAADLFAVDAAWPQRPAEVTWGDMNGVTVGPNDEVWCFSSGVPPIQLYDRHGKFQRGFGQGWFRSAHHIRLDPDGNLWVADSVQHVVLKVSPQGEKLLTLGVSNEKGADAQHFDMPTDVAVTAQGDVFVADGYCNARIVHFDRSGRFVKEFGKLGVGVGELSLPHSLVIDAQGLLYVAERNNARIQVFNQAGESLATWPGIMIPWGLWATADGHIWACGSTVAAWKPDQKLLGWPPHDQILVKFDRQGQVRQLWGLPLGKEGNLRPGDTLWVHAIAADSQGNLYCGDTRGQRLQKWTRVPASAPSGEQPAR